MPAVRCAALSACVDLALVFDAAAALLHATGPVGAAPFLALPAAKAFAARSPLLAPLLGG